MCSLSWQIPLRQVLRNRSKADTLPRVAVVGMGHDLNGDDAAGLVVARALLPLAAQYDRLLVLEAGAAPENQTGPLRAFEPDLILFVDAAQMGAEAGAVRWLAWEDTTGISASSHTLPPYMLAKFLIADLGCEVALLGIQPAQNAFESPLSDVVAAAVADVIEGLTTVFQA